MTLHMPIGTHLLVDLYGCQKFEFNKNQLDFLVTMTRCTPLKYVEHEFKPQGKSAVMLLEESHITIHTYPEFGYIAVDIYTCGEKAEPYNAISMLKTMFKPQYVLINDINRGVKQ